MSHHIEHLAQLAADGINNKDLTSEEYVELIAETLPLLAVEFPEIKMRVAKKHISDFCGFWRRGIVERIAQDCAENRVSIEDLAELCEPYGILDVKRFEKEAQESKYAFLHLSGEKIDRLSGDLLCGLEMSKENETPCMEVFF